MCKNYCDNCKYAEWEYMDAYYGGYWGIGGCNFDCSKIQEDEWDEDWGIEKDCPYWEEVEEEKGY